MLRQTRVGECGKAFNIADIRSEKAGEETIIMPPLNPPAECFDKMTQRPDDTEEVVRARLDAVQKVDHSRGGLLPRARIVERFPHHGRNS